MVRIECHFVPMYKMCATFRKTKNLNQIKISRCMTESQSWLFFNKFKNNHRKTRAKIANRFHFVWCSVHIRSNPSSLLAFEYRNLQFIDRMNECEELELCAPFTKFSINQSLIDLMFEVRIAALLLFLRIWELKAQRQEAKTCFLIK